MNRLVRLKLNKFSQLQGDRTEEEMANVIGISRTQLWRIKRGVCAAGENFISGVMAAFPEIRYDEIFFTDSVPQMERGGYSFSAPCDNSQSFYPDPDLI